MRSPSSASCTCRKSRTRRRAIEAQDCEIVELTADEHEAFAAAVQPLLDEARATYGRELFDLASV